MTKPADERRVRKLPVIAGEGERARTDYAIVLWLARHGRSEPITAELRGEVLDAICTAWRMAEIEGLKGD